MNNVKKRLTGKVTEENIWPRNRTCEKRMLKCCIMQKKKDQQEMLQRKIFVRGNENVKRGS